MVVINSRKVSPHVNAASTLIIDAVKKKADYAPDIAILAEKGMSQKNIAKLLNMSSSYVSKLLKK